MSLLALLVLTLLPAFVATTSTDDSRLGTYYTALNLYRTGAGTNVLSVGVGLPSVQDLNLTLSTNVDYIMVATSDCSGCVTDSSSYDATTSTSLTTSSTALDYTFNYPTASSETYELTGEFAHEILTDARDDTTNTRPIVLVGSVLVNSPVHGTQGQGGTASSLPTGTAGFWGLGVDTSRLQSSIIPNMLTVTGAGAPNNATSFTVGFDMANYTDLPGSNAGTIHWGAVPVGAYTGNFNWLKVNTSFGGSWAVGFDSVRVGGSVVQGNGYFATLDPGFDPIYVPSKVAEQLFASVSSASRDLVDTTRWNIPCDTSISMTVSISGVSYAVDPGTLVASRDQAGQTCWSNLVAWENGSLPEAQGEVRLGTAFLSGVYSALYYSSDEMLVGIAGKPGSVNDSNLGPSSSGHANAKLAGILIGSLLAALVLVFLLCYARNRNSFQSIWYRSIRRQQRAQMNAVIRAQTMPPPMMGVGPPMMPMPMAPAVGPVPYPGVYPGQPGPGMPYGPRPYQPVPTASYHNPVYGGNPGYGGGNQVGHQLPAYNAPMDRSVRNWNVPGSGRNAGFAMNDPRARAQGLSPVVEPEQRGGYSPRQYNAGLGSVASATPATALVPFFSRSGTGRARWSAPSLGGQGEGRGGENVRWGGVGTRVMRSASTASASAASAAARQGMPETQALPVMVDAPRPYGVESSEKRADEFARRFMGRSGSGSHDRPEEKRWTIGGGRGGGGGERLPDEVGKGLQRMPSKVPGEQRWRASKSGSGWAGVGGGGVGAGGNKDRERMEEAERWQSVGAEYQ